MVLKSKFQRLAHEFGISGIVGLEHEKLPQTVLLILDDPTCDIKLLFTFIVFTAHTK